MIYCFNCVHSFRTKSNLRSNKKTCEDKDFCKAIMLSGDTRILEFSQYQKSDKASLIIYANLASFIQKNHGCNIHPQQK